MRLLKITFLSVVLLGILSCDDALVTMDIYPPVHGYLWRVDNGGEWANLNAYSFREGYDGGYTKKTPFKGGDGTVWVSGFLREGDGGNDAIWEPDVGLYLGEGGGGLTYDGEYLWYTRVKDFYRFNPDTTESELVFTFVDPNIYWFKGLTYENGFLWGIAESSDAFKLLKIDPADGSLMTTISFPEDDPGLQEPRGLAWDGEAFWVNDYKSSRMYRLDGEDGHILGYIERQNESQPPDEPWGLAFGDGPTTPPDK